MPTDHASLRLPRGRMPPLNALKAFEVAARHESLVRAADELGVTHGAVSKQIRSLEEHLGEPLFHRRNRAIFLTHRGRQLAGHLAAAFLDLENALEDFRGHRGEQELIVSCEPTLCLKLLIPNVSDLKEKTGLNVRILAAGGRIDFRRDHVDLAVRRNDFPIDAGIHSRILAPEVVGLVCAPGVAASFRSTPARSRLTALHTRSRPDAWALWMKGRRSGRRFTGEATYEHFYLAIEAAIAGQGVALASIYMVASDLASGRLHALSGFESDGTCYVALSRTNLQGDPRLALFGDWLADVMTTIARGAPPPM